MPPVPVALVPDFWGVSWVATSRHLDAINDRARLDLARLDRSAITPKDARDINSSVVFVAFSAPVSRCTTLADKRELRQPQESRFREQPLESVALPPLVHASLPHSVLAPCADLRRQSAVRHRVACRKYCRTPALRL
ncbi:hypothetical protein TgHK011_007141 [Trichoderma gracile]|nr:hypothetical protein TgHK011_007141 [Trichoderma gracile]